jgi:hypothetical protein
MADNGDNGDPIHITHYINPHMFWFKYMTDLRNPELVDLQHKLDMHYSKEAATKSGYKPKLDEVCIIFFIKVGSFYLIISNFQIVAVFHLTSDRWIRVQVDGILEYNLEENKYMLFAIDHG